MYLSLPLVYLPGISNFLLLYVANTAVAAMFVGTFCLILVVRCNPYIDCYLIMNNSLFAREKRMVIWNNSLFAHEKRMVI